jgi:hypothetical protein
MSLLNSISNREPAGWTFSQLEREQETLITLYAMVHEITLAINVYLGGARIEPLIQ